jgi:hypothetical protein
MDDAPHLIGKILNEEVTPQQVMAAVGASEFRVESPGMCYTGDYRTQRIRISVTENNRIVGLLQG